MIFGTVFRVKTLSMNIPSYGYKDIVLNSSSRSQQLLSQLVPDLVHPVRLARNTGVQIDSNHRDAAHQILTDYHRELQQTLDTSDEVIINL